MIVTLERLSASFIGCDFTRRRKMLAVVGHWLNKPVYEVANFTQTADGQIILILKEVKG